MGLDPAPFVANLIKKTDKRIKKIKKTDIRWTRKFAFKYTFNFIDNLTVLKWEIYPPELELRKDYGINTGSFLDLVIKIEENRFSVSLSWFSLFHC